MNREYSVSIVATNWVSVQASSEDEAAEKALSLGVFETLDGADYNVVSISGPEDQPPPEPPTEVPEPGALLTLMLGAGALWLRLRSQSALPQKVKAKTGKRRG